MIGIHLPQALFFSEENHFLGVLCGSDRTSRCAAFLAHLEKNIIAPESFHLTLYLDNIIESVDKEAHGSIRPHDASFESDDGALVITDMIHHTLEHGEASAESANLGNDNRITLIDWLQQAPYSPVRDTAHGEVILDEVIIYDTILYAPRNKGLALLLECGGIVVDGEVEVVHG